MNAIGHASHRPASVRALKWLAFLGLLALPFLLLLPAGNRLSKQQIEQLQSNNYLAGIGRLILDYERAHQGQMPANLSEIIPDDRTDLVAFFSAPVGTERPRPANWKTDQALLETWSDYLPSRQPGSMMIAYERSGLWPDGTIAVCFTNLNVERLSATRFKELLERDASTHP